ncbi:hypothetical protein HMI56_000742 [Coelomomyces lativittatus]|nr:hypothetical protein HMI56_000742 [Coelomomyces lativittatus]
MAPLRVLLLLFLSMSLPALISVQTVASQGKLGIQNTKPLTFRYANNIFEFGPFKVDFSQDTEGLTYNLSTFLAYFATALDIPTSSGEIADNVFKEKLASVAKEMLETFQDPKVSPFLFNMFLTPENQNFIQQNHQEIKKYFMSVKESLRVMWLNGWSCILGHYHSRQMQ